VENYLNIQNAEFSLEEFYKDITLHFSNPKADKQLVYNLVKKEESLFI